MSDFKIIGNPNPVVGKEEFYSVNNVLPSVLPFQNTAINNNPFEHPVKWEIYILENGRWRKTKENDKTGKRISYTFFQKSLDRKGIRILARRGEEIARLDIETQPAEKPKIDSIELLDKNGKKPTVPLSYGQTLKARVHCLHMERRKIYVTLWEDDAAGSGHNKTNEKNVLDTRSGIVKDGIVDIDFLLKPSFVKIAKMSKDEGKIHEYYVTTDFDNEKLASKNVDVNDLETPVAPYKGKTTHPQQPAKTATPAQPTKSHTPTSSAPTTPKGEITKVHITDTAGRAINGIFKEKQIRVYVDSKGLIGKEVRLKLYDHDNGSSNDLLIEEKFVIKANIHARTISLDTIPRSLGGNLLQEGAEQELFAEVEVVQTNKGKASEKVEVDAKVFKQDQGEIVNMVMKVFQPSAEDKKEGVCVCKEYDLVWGNKFTCDERKKVVEICAELWGEDKKKKMANQLMVCMALETGEAFKPNTGYPYATGLVQWTGTAIDGMNKNNKYNKGSILTKSRLADMSVIKQLDYVKLYFKMWMDSGKVINDSLDMYMCIWCPAAVGKNDSFVCYSEEDSAKYYNANKSIDGEYYREKYTNAKGKVVYNTVGKDTGNGEITKGELKPRLKVKEVSGVANKAKVFNCGLDNAKTPLDAKDIVAYHIYSDGKIEKHIPKVIKDENKYRYKYVYHDANSLEHNICIADWHTTKEKGVGQVNMTKPTHSKIISDENVSEGNTSRRVKYENGDIAEYGAHPKKGQIWLLYKASSNDIELLKMPDSLSYNKNDVKISYVFSSTQRRYTGVGSFAGFIGLLAETKLKLTTTGSCFSEGSSFPSQEHCNGRSVDLLYIKEVAKDQLVIDSGIKFHFTEVLKGVNDYCDKLKNAGNGGSLHDSHLHSGNFDISKVKLIKE